MYAQVMANVGVNFKFYRRNRLLLVAGLLIMLVTALSTVPSLFFLTKAQHLSIIITAASQLSNFATIIIPALGLMLISHHLGNRSIKMVFTKPCLPEAWLVSSSISAVIVAALFYIGIFLICTMLFAVWSIQFQWGLVFVLLNDFAHTLIWLGYITFLAVFFRPVVAVLFVIIFQEGSFYYLKLLLISGIKTATGSLALFLKLAKGLVDVIYMLLPLTNPFQEKTEHVYKSLRGGDADWLTLIATWGYALGISLFFFLLAGYFLKKKRLI
jgi:hypothetical protein